MISTFEELKQAVAANPGSMTEKVCKLKISVEITGEGVGIRRSTEDDYANYGSIIAWQMAMGEADRQMTELGLAALIGSKSKQAGREGRK